MPSPLVYAALAAMGVFLACMALALPARSTDETEAPDKRPSRPGRTARVEATTLRERINQPFQAIADQSSYRRRLNGGLTLAEHLARANLKLRSSEFVMLQVAFLLLGAALALMRFGLGPQVVFGAVGAYLLPMRYIRHRQRQRHKAFSRQLPDTLSLLSNALKAGFSLPQALESVSRNTSPPISEELGRVIRETNLGTPLETALNNLVRRIGSEDLDLIVTAIVIQSAVGGNLARVLDSISHTIRQRIQVKGQISALTAQARASGWVITLLPFVVAGILYLITPAYFRPMFSERAGQAMLVLVLISIGIGNLFIRRIVNFRV